MTRSMTRAQAEHKQQPHGNQPGPSGWHQSYSQEFEGSHWSSASNSQWEQHATSGVRTTSSEVYLPMLVHAAPSCSHENRDSVILDMTSTTFRNKWVISRFKQGRHKEL
uniref:Uncharacterized protein n=1 Tax=Arundo donax TaxID=35708 RepID=A0A0A9D6Y7_ARUDO